MKKTVILNKVLVKSSFDVEKPIKFMQFKGAFFKSVSEIEGSVFVKRDSDFLKALKGHTSFLETKTSLDELFESGEEVYIEIGTGIMKSEKIKAEFLDIFFGNEVNDDEYIVSGVIRKASELLNFMNYNKDRRNLDYYTMDFTDDDPEFQEILEEKIDDNTKLSPEILIKMILDKKEVSSEEDIIIAEINGDRKVLKNSEALEKIKDFFN